MRKRNVLYVASVVNRLTPYPHQQAGTDFLISGNGGAVFAEARAGKTLMVLRALEKLEHKPVLIVAPSTVLASWYGALIEDGIPHEKIVVFDGKHSTKVSNLRNILISEEYDYFIINYEKIIDSNSFNIRMLQPKIFNIPGWGAIILDESYRIASFDSNISKYIMKHPKPDNQFRAVVTGTPICESVLDVVQPYIFLNNDFFGYNNSEDYRLNYYNYFGFKWKAKSRIHSAKVETFVKDNSYQVQLKDLNLGGEIFYGMTIIPKPKIIKGWLKWLSTTTVYEHRETGEIMDLIPPVKIMFAQKICAGINPLTDEIINNSKTEWIANLIEDDKIPSLILSRFKKPLDELKKALFKRGIGCEIIDGSVSLENRELIRQKFQRGEITVVIAQTDTVARGLDFSTLGRIINHSNSFSYEVRGQSVLRGQNVKRVTPYEVIDVCIEDSVDVEVVDKLFNKKETVKQFIKEFKYE